MIGALCPPCQVAQQRPSAESFEREDFFWNEFFSANGWGDSIECVLDPSESGLDEIAKCPCFSCRKITAREAFNKREADIVSAEQDRLRQLIKDSPFYPWATR